VKRNWVESLKPLIVVLIALLAGPEFFLGMELLALLDLLGVGLFLLAHQVAVRVALSQLFSLLCRWAIPIHLLARPTLDEVRRAPRLISLAVPISLFYLSWCALGFLLVAIGVQLHEISA
jgi:hypothetical protein